MNRLTWATLAVVGGLLAASPARSALVTYDLAGTISSGPLDGQSFGGHLSFQDSPPGPGRTLVELSFSFNGSTVDPLSVETEVHVFADDFVLTFGTACTRFPPGLSCNVSAGDSRWYVQMESTVRRLFYSAPGSPALAATFNATLRTGTLPEPGTLALALAAGLAGWGARRRSATAAQPSAR